MTSLETRFAAVWAALQRPPGLALLGVSGGADSLALLRLMAAIAPRYDLALIVVHADHGLHPASGAVAARVAEYAATLDIETRIGTLRLPAGSSEAVAREARYRWFHRQLDATGARSLVLAHHREDQAETILMRVLAGSGPAGLAGMQPVHRCVVRPLLEFGRDELRRLLDRTGWEPWDDPANRDPRHTRSWLRRDVLPILEAREPNLVARLVRLGTQAAADRRAWETALERLSGLALQVEHRVVSVAAAPLIGYDSALARAVLRALARRAGLTIGGRAVERLLGLAEAGVSGRWTPLGGGWRGEIAFGRLRIVQEAGDWEAVEVDLADRPAGSLRVDRWLLRWRTRPATEPPRRDGWRTSIIPGRYRVRPWRPGDRLRPLGGPGSRLVVRCMQDRQVARSERVGWPVIVAAESNAVVWVPGVSRAEGWAPAPGEEGVEVDVKQS